MYIHTLSEKAYVSISTIRYVHTHIQKVVQQNRITPEQALANQKQTNKKRQKKELL